MKYQGLIWAGIYVEDLGASVSFYQNVLGMALLDKSEDWAHFDSGAGTLLELFSGGKSTPEAKKPDQQSIVLGLRVENLERAVTELQQKGVLCARSTPSGSPRSAAWRARSRTRSAIRSA